MQGASFSPAKRSSRKTELSSPQTQYESLRSACDGQSSFRFTGTEKSPFESLADAMNQDVSFEDDLPQAQETKESNRFDYAPDLNCASEYADH